MVARKIDRPRGILSEADRKYLLADEEEREENYTRQGRAKREKAIAERTHHALRDFQLLLECLPPAEREDLFQLVPRRDTDVKAMLTFIYAGMGGRARFKPLLEGAIANGECELGNAYSPMLVAVSDFDVTIHNDEDMSILAEEALEKLEDGEPLDALSKDELFSFAFFADKTDAFDLQSVREFLEYREDTIENLQELSEELGE